jgi:TRAP-type C4-dicarboxylate transport system permease small subunit
MNGLSGIYTSYTLGLRRTVLLMAGITGLGIILMALITCADVILRLVGYPIVGSFDLVRVAGAVSMAFALPYTTAVKGHVAIEYFFQKLDRKGRIILDTVSRIISISFFSILAFQSVRYGLKLQVTGEVTPTLQLPMFWVPWAIAFSCVVMVLVIFHNLTHPGKGLIKP